MVFDAEMSTAYYLFRSKHNEHQTSSVYANKNVAVAYHLHTKRISITATLCSNINRTFSCSP